jgi:hypothetical protein
MPSPGPPSPLVPADVGIQPLPNRTDFGSGKAWIPTSAGMIGEGLCTNYCGFGARFGAGVPGLAGTAARAGVSASSVESFASCSSVRSLPTFF